MNKSLTTTLIVTFSLIGILILSTLIAGFTHKSFKPEFATPNSISFKYDSGNLQSVNADEAEFAKLNNAFENAFKKPNLTALFDGTASKKVVAENTNQTITTTGTLLRLNFNEKQTLKIGGEVYKNNGVEVKYDVVYLAVTDIDGFRNVNMFLDDNNDNRAHCYVTTIANTGDLFDVIKELAQRHTA